MLETKYQSDSDKSLDSNERIIEVITSQPIIKVTTITNLELEISSFQKQRDDLDTIIKQKQSELADIKTALNL